MEESKESPTPPSEADQAPTPTSATSKEAVVSLTPHGIDDPVPRLHAKTFLAVIAVCLIYFAQLVSIVGAGVVSAPEPQPGPPSLLLC
jgi:hypothetical protein